MTKNKGFLTLLSMLVFLLFVSCSMVDDTIGDDTNGDQISDDITDDIVDDTTDIIDDIVDDTTDIIDDIVDDTTDIIDDIVDDTTDINDSTISDDDDIIIDDGTGVVIVSDRIEELELIVQGDSLSATQELSLQDIRDEIEKEKMLLSTFSILDISLTGKDSEAFIAAHGTKRAVLKMYLIDPTTGGTKELALTTPPEGAMLPVLTVAQILGGIKKNSGLYIQNPGFSNFASSIQDLTKDKITIIADLVFLDPVADLATTTVTFTIKGQGKKKI